MATKEFEILYTGINLPILKAVGMGPSRSKVTVTDDHLHVKMGWGFDGLIPRSQISSAETATKPRRFGWGVHGWSGTWVINGSNDGIVKLTIDPPVHARILFFAIRPHTIYISLEDPDGFLETLNA